VALGSAARRYPAKALDQLCGIAADSAFVGISVMTNYFAAAVEISAALRREFPDKPIVWGGVHPTLRPVECLDHADVVVRGEAETNLVALAERLEAGEEPIDVPGVVSRSRGRLYRVPVPPLVTDLDRLPAPDMEVADQHLLWQGQLVAVTGARMAQMLARTTVGILYGKVTYQTLTSRGCPHHCAYCINSTIRDLYPGQRYVRFRSAESVVDELVAVVARHPSVDYVWFSDDVFFARPLPELTRLARLYRERVGLPFYLLASPTSITEDKYRVMVDAGLHHIQMGIESGSAKTRALFERQRMDEETVLRAAGILAGQSHRTQIPHYDLITNIPWEDDADRRETLRLVARLPRPYRLQLFTLVLYPETVAFERARRDGLVDTQHHRDYEAMYGTRRDTYLNLLLSLASKGVVPGPILRALADDRLDTLVGSRSMRAAEALARRTLRGVRLMRDQARYQRKMEVDL
jgi:radical SAM superfamily enzyme YgiQ (UPF0313 family)